ncbi:unnamed protein product [Heterobilharzia americana]|nr:unnamed protein product [Heterobilharzia americana]
MRVKVDWRQKPAKFDLGIACSDTAYSNTVNDHEGHHNSYLKYRSVVNVTKMRIPDELRRLLNLAVLAFSAFVSVYMSLFISDQFVYYSCLSEQGIDYWSVSTNDSIVGRDYAQKKAALIQCIKNFLGMGVGIFSTLIVGCVSDKRGRRLALGIVVLGEALKVLAVSVIVFFNLSPWSFILCEILEGSIGGGLLSVSAQLAACIADMTQITKYVIVPGSNIDQMKHAKRMIKKRWLLFTLLDSVLTCGMAFANVLTGFLIVHYRFDATMLTCIAFLIPLPIALYFMTETSIKVVQVERTATENPSDDLCDNVSIVSAESADKRSFDGYSVHVRSTTNYMSSFRVISQLPRTHFIITALIFMFSISGITDVPYVSLYLMSDPFLWNTQTLGLFIGLRDVSCTFMSVLCVSLVARFQRNQSSKFSSGDCEVCGSNCLDFIGIFWIDTLSIHQIVTGLAFKFPVPTANIVIYLATIPRFTKGFQVSVLRTIISKWTEVSKQGIIMSVIAVVERLGIMISATALPAIYSATIGSFKGSVFMVCASMTILEALIVLALPVYAPKVSNCDYC